MNKPGIHPEQSRRICAVIVNTDLEAIESVENMADLFEVRIDMVGDGWQGLVRKLRKPWIATNRHPEEGGRWTGTEAMRIEELFRAVELGAQIIDIELRTQDLADIVRTVKQKAKCLLSFHDFEKTLPFEELDNIVHEQVKAGADICKVVTTARHFEDNLTIFRLTNTYRGNRLVAFAMGPEGQISRVLGPLAGADFTYASIAAGKESAPGQVTVEQLRKIYGTLRE